MEKPTKKQKTSQKKKLTLEQLIETGKSLHWLEIKFKVIHALIECSYPLTSKVNKSSLRVLSAISLFRREIKELVFLEKASVCFAALKNKHGEKNTGDE